MDVIIAGSWPPKKLNRLELEAWYNAHMPILKQAIEDSGFTVTRIISGQARGMDTLGERWANSQSPFIPVIPKPAMWKRDDGRTDMGAGKRRNCAMGEIAGAAIIVIINGSGGSEHMLRVMHALGKPVYVVRLKEAA